MGDEGVEMDDIDVEDGGMEDGEEDARGDDAVELWLGLGLGLGPRLGPGLGLGLGIKFRKGVGVEDVKTGGRLKGVGGCRRCTHTYIHTPHETTIIVMYGYTLAPSEAHTPCSSKHAWQRL